MSRNRRNHVDIDYSDGGAIVPTKRLQGMLNHVQQQGGLVNQQSGMPMSVDSQPVEVRYVKSQTSYKPKVPQIEIPYVETWKAHR